MNVIASQYPSRLRWLAAIMATALAAPLLSPVYWIWGFVAFEGSTGAVDLIGGLVSGAMVAYTFSWPAVVAGVPLFAALIYWQFGAWSGRQWWQWFLFGAFLASIAVSTVLALFGGEEGAFAILPAIFASAPAGGLAALIFRRILLGTSKQSGDAEVTPTEPEVKHDV